ncbi:MAG: hypothetical protein P8X49_15290 [Syntrophobacterales bacterium]
MGLSRTFGAMRQDWPLDQELRMLAGGQLCHDEERKRCRVENGAFADWACRACAERVRPEAISPWTWHLVFLYQLSRAGYPFKANDLSLETWLLMGTVRRVLEGVQRGQHG